MLIVIAYCERDAPATAKLLAWIHELEGRTIDRHRLLLVAAQDTSSKVFLDVKLEAVQTFSRVVTTRTNRPDNRPWPKAQNTMFKCAASFVMANFKCPFWWNEPDCIPILKGAYDMLEDEYNAAGKPFLGAIAPLPRPHLTGCALYPARIDQYNSEILKTDGIAWDGVAPDTTLRFTHNTNLFQHLWLQPNGQLPTFPTTESLKVLRPGAVIFHRNKDMTLIDRLRESDNSIKPVWRSDILAEKRYNEIQPVAEPAQAPEVKPEVSSYVVPKRNLTKVFTYYEDVPAMGRPTSLLTLWESLWREQGWEPVILSEKDAEKDPDFKTYSKAIKKLPTVNHPRYERACYMRHLAMKALGGGLLVDYDVIPMSFTPDDAMKLPQSILEPTKVPCAIWASEQCFEQICREISSYQLKQTDLYGKDPHISDMEILRQTYFSTLNACVEYLCSGSSVRDDPGDGWKAAPLIHFSTGSMHKDGRFKSKLALIADVLVSLRAAKAVKASAMERPPKNLLVILCRGAEDSTSRDFQKYWEQSGCDLMLSSPLDDPSRIIDIHRVEFGQAYKREDQKTWYRYQSRVLDTMKYCLTLKQYDGFIFTQYDSVPLKPIPPIYPEDNIHHFFLSDDERFSEAWFVHPPWCFGKNKLRQFVQSADQLDIVTSEHGVMDRWMSKVMTAGGMTLTQSNKWTWSANSVDTPELIASARDAIAKGARFIHGVKNKQQLESILQDAATKETTA